MKSIVLNNKRYIELEYIKSLFPEIEKHLSKSEISKNTPLSARKAVMITMEKRIELGNVPRYKLVRENIIKQSKVDFNVRNRNYERYPTLEDAHPENPCLKYEEDGRKKSHYKRSINFISINQSWLLENQSLINKFNSIKEDIDLC